MMKTTRLCSGMYKVEAGGRVYIIEDVTKDVDPRDLARNGRLWHISEQTNTGGVLYRHPPCDAAPTLADAKAMVAGWCHPLNMDFERYGAKDLATMPTLAQGQADDLKVDTGSHRWWLSRCGPEDGVVHSISVECLVHGVWVTAHTYNRP